MGWPTLDPRNPGDVRERVIQAAQELYEQNGRETIRKKQKRAPLRAPPPPVTMAGRKRPGSLLGAQSTPLQATYAAANYA